jgi:purine-binding chemotaxis protein CheW
MGSSVTPTPSSSTGSSPWGSDDLAARVAAALAEVPAEAAYASTAHLLVAARTLLCALPVLIVREVVPWTGATRIPGAPATVRGLINHRGGIVTVLDLAACTGDQAPAQGRADGSIVLVDHGSRMAGLAVDRVVAVYGPPISPAAGPDGRDADAGAWGALADGRAVFLPDVEGILTHVLESEGEL